MIEEISEFLYSFKNKVVEAEDLASKYDKQIEKYSSYLIENGHDTEFEENFLTILGYSYRLEDVTQRLFFTFQEAVYAIDLDKLMKNDDSLKLNTIVYTLVLNVLINEYKSGQVDMEQKIKALEVYGKIEESKAKENKKYHMYQN